MSGNGVDLAAVYQLLREVADRIIAHDDKFAAIERRLDREFREMRSDVAELRHTLTQDHSSAWVTAS